MKRIRRMYSNLRIKYKMFLLISFVLIAFSVGGISILQYAFHVYNEEIYRQSAQSLRVSSQSIETELKKMDRLSYQVATDQYIQTYLEDLKQSDDEFEHFMIGTELRKRLLEIGALNKYVNSLQVYDLQDTEYKVGNHMLTIPKERLEKIKTKAKAKNGRVQWIFPEGSDSSFMSVRDIRSYLHLSLDRLGMIAVRFDIEDIISDILGDVSNTGTKLIILNENEELVYPVNINLPDFINNIEGGKGYKLIEIKGEQYFATYSPAKHTNWTYVILSPYSSLFQAITSVRKAVIITYTILFILVMFIGMRFIGGITEPIERLNRKMKRVQTGEFELHEDGSEAQLSKDESGEMHENFHAMLNQINYLIEENYKKQIVIKDAEFKTLQAQINPHFLYNTLDSINWAAKMDKKKKASDMAESLGYILRSSINMKDSLITLEDELKVVEKYIMIQSYRFEERLVFNMDVPKSIYNCKIPKFVIQPLIENSILYGVQKMIDPCTISLTGKVLNQQLILTVEDNGPGMDQQFLTQLLNETYESKGTGIGLSNIRERIKLLFGNTYGIEVESGKNKGTRVHITIPYESGL